jgi:hypothetical protein
MREKGAWNGIPSGLPVKNIQYSIKQIRKYNIFERMSNMIHP